MRNKCSSVLQEHCASELCIFCKTQDSVIRTSNREVSFHSIISENKCTQLFNKGQGRSFDFLVCFIIGMPFMLL